MEIEKVEFDSLESGVNSMVIENNQISIFDYANIDLPPINIDIENTRRNVRRKSKRETKSKDNKEILTRVHSEAILSGNATISKGRVDIKSIKTLQEKEEFKSDPIKKLDITGTNGKSTSFINAVSNKTKQDIENRNKELLKTRKHPYKKKSCILTDAEKKCYNFLKSRLGNNVIIFSKVRLADVVELNELISRDSKEFYKIAYKHLDYLVMSNNLDLICAVELDDYTHNTPDVIARDKFVESVMQDCSIPFYRIKTRVNNLTRDDTYNIEMCVLEYLAPICPECGRPMEPKMSRRKSNYGHRFYGCLGWYEHGENKCMCTIDID